MKYSIFVVRFSVLKSHHQCFEQCFRKQLGSKNANWCQRGEPARYSTSKNKNKPKHKQKRKHKQTKTKAKTSKDNQHKQQHKQTKRRVKSILFQRHILIIHFLSLLIYLIILCPNSMLYFPFVHVDGHQ